MLRFALSPSGGVVLDLAHKLPGAGVYVVPTRIAVEGLKSSSFKENFKKEVLQAPNAQDIIDIVQRDVLNRLKLAKKANQLIIGAAELKAASTANIQAIFIAQDAGKEAQKRAKASASEHTKIITCFNQQTLEGALGVPHCTLVGLSGLDIFAGTLHKYIDFLT